MEQPEEKLKTYCTAEVCSLAETYRHVITEHKRERKLEKATG